MNLLKRTKNIRNISKANEVLEAEKLNAIGRKVLEKDGLK